MASSIDVLIDGFGRVRESVQAVLDGEPGPEVLEWRADSEANTVAWLVWHLTRVQDDHIAAAAGTQQRWTADGWVERFALPLSRDTTGYGHSPEDVAAVRADAALLGRYYEAVHDATTDYLRGLADDDLDRVVDTRWDPPVTLGVRLVSVLDDDLEHVGQAAFLRGVAERRSGSGPARAPGIPRSPPPARPR